MAKQNKKNPGEFFEILRLQTTPGTFLIHLHMSSLKPCESKQKTREKIFTHKDLNSCTHVFLRKDRVKKALEPAYEGSFKVIFRKNKFYTLQVKGKEIQVSIHRLKPAYILTSDQ